MKEQASSQEQTLVLDNGDFIGGSSHIEKLRARYMLQGLAMLKYDAINLGERDFLLGAKFLLMMQKNHQLPFISANVFYEDSSTHFVKPYIIKELKGRMHGDTKIPPLKVGIFGVMMKRPTLIYKSDEVKLITREPIQMAQQVVNELKDKCDIIIALAHLSSSQIYELVSFVKGIDIVIGSHDFYKRDEATELNDTIMMQVGSKGQYIGDLKVTLDRERNISSHDSKMILLDSQFKDDPTIKNLIMQYEAEYKKITQLAFPED